MHEQDIQAWRKAQEWDQFLQSCRPDIGYKQSSWWAEFLQTRGWGRFGLVVSDEGLIVGGARVLVVPWESDSFFYYIPHGPVLPERNGDREEVFQVLMADIMERRKTEPYLVSHLRIEPHWQHPPTFVRGFQEASNWLEPRDTLRVDLSHSETAILKQMKPKGRYNIQVALRHGVSVVEDTSPRGIADFLHLYHETVERHDIVRHRSSYFHELSASLFPFDRGSIFFAEFQGMRLATALVVYFGDTATYKYGGSGNAHRNVMAPYLLHFEAMRRAKARGHRWYDFYGVAPRDMPEHRWANISAFKRRFGGSELSFVPGLDYVFDADAYRDYRGRKSPASDATE